MIVSVRSSVSQRVVCRVRKIFFPLTKLCHANASLLSVEESIPHGWEYIKFSPHVTPALIPQDDEGIYELALVVSYSQT